MPFQIKVSYEISENGAPQDGAEYHHHCLNKEGREAIQKLLAKLGSDIAELSRANQVRG